jgi:hypothetical protein
MEGAWKLQEACCMTQPAYKLRNKMQSAKVIVKMQILPKNNKTANFIYKLVL